MKLIIAGSRHFDLSVKELHGLILTFDLYPSEIVSGGASGIDSATIDFYNVYKDDYPIPLKIKMFYADWTKHGKAAGPIRNAKMAKYADALLLVWDGKSRGKCVDEEGNGKTRQARL